MDISSPYNVGRDNIPLAVNWRDDIPPHENQYFIRTDDETKSFHTISPQARHNRITLVE